MLDVSTASRQRDTALRAGYAALGMCWRGIGRPSSVPFQGSVLAYGGAVLDALVGSGANIHDCSELAVDALALCIEAIPDLGAAAEAEDFTDSGSTPESDASDGSKPPASPSP
jgi:hypothetical protein